MTIAVIAFVAFVAVMVVSVVIGKGLDERERKYGRRNSIKQDVSDSRCNHIGDDEE